MITVMTIITITIATVMTIITIITMITIITIIPIITIVTIISVISSPCRRRKEMLAAVRWPLRESLLILRIASDAEAEAFLMPFRV